MKRGAIFARGPRYLRLAKLAMALLDAVAVLAVAQLSAAASHAACVLALAASMFVWHNAENVLWPRRFEVHVAPLYPAGQIWPHLGFTATLIAGAGEWMLARGDALPLHGTLGWQLSGLIAFWAGAGVRLWAFSTRGRDYLADPRTLSSPPRRGPYAFARHPAPWALCVLSLGSAAVMLSPLAAAVALIFGGAAALYVARREARAWRAVPSVATASMTENMS